ncbi:ATP/GTP-binding protein [Streptomyces sp. RK75]|uniref:ATP/GTP-binding protein n=1 Tax=Streptomyces sp. RK75 TaxID=2824895 RepID=UPI001B37663D|nr:ATP/GTP-binding protein [Streptomyces sp. RK75]MBQ0867347.1 ATP/GTP-binding protein [Streptomyces sp. RK75]
MSAGEAFVNREIQWQAVTTAVTARLWHICDPAFDVEDLEAPRGNVLVFHGIGGIGKTSLSRKLEAALADHSRRPSQWGEPRWEEARIVPVRIDLSRSAGTDFERLVLTLRLALTQLGRPLPAFDLALRRYWEHQHPGEPLEEYLRRGGLARFGQELPQQIQSALSDAAQALALPGTVGGLIGQVTGSLIGALRERRQTVRALAACRRLADLLEAEPDLESLSYYPHLLAWELAQLPADSRVLPVVLLDTFEDVGDRTHRDLERLIQRVVWLMPNALFIVTGRSRLQWGDAALHGQLDWAGPTAWPGLAAHSLPHLPDRGPEHDHGRQVLIGDFSPEDCEDYLARRLSHDGQPLIPADIRQVIAHRSHGLPLYLDLSVMRFLEIRRSGRTPTADDFSHDFPALIARTLADLTPEERTVLRSVSLLDAFDLELATQAAGLDRQAPALRLSERPFVREDPFALWPFHLHALIRSTIRNADDQTDDRWSPGDWQHAAQRALAAVGEAWRAGAGPGRRLLVGCLRQGLQLARDFHLELDWLAEAAWAYVSDSVWEPLAPPAREGASARLETAADALVETLSALARRQHEHRERTAARLAAVADTGLLPAGLQEMAVYYLAKAQRDLGDSTASRRGMQQVADGGGRLAPAARRGLAHLARLAGDFPTALATARQLGWKGRGHRVEGDVWWPQGDMDRAAAAYQAARLEAEQHGVAGERATCQAQRAFVLAFTDPGVADDEIDLAEQLLTGLDLRATGLTVRIAALIRDAGRTDAEVEDRAQVLRTEARVAGVVAAEAMLDLALAFHHAVQGDHHQLADPLSRLQTLAQDGDYAYYADIVCFMADLSLARAATWTQWLDAAATVRARWQTLVQHRRAAA